MEDRYLFKAKSLDNGEWVQGCYIYNIDRDCSESLNKFAHRIQPLYAHAYAEPIDPSTICQCTGLKDKNGNLIWENDIVRDEHGNFYKAFWHNNYYQFSWICVKSDVLIGAKWDLWSFRSFEIEVIGNIFDNKDLLESEK